MTCIMKILPVILLLFSFSACSWSEILRKPGYRSPSKEITVFTDIKFRMEESAEREMTEKDLSLKEEFFEELKEIVQGKVETSDKIDSLRLNLNVKNLRLRRNFTARWFGILSGYDFLEAELTVQHPTGRILDQGTIFLNYSYPSSKQSRKKWLLKALGETVVDHITPD